MARWKLKRNCCFVDATDNLGNRPHNLPLAKVIDKTDQNTNKCLDLNDGAAFVARFIVQGVDTDLIQQILLSEYRNFTPAEAQQWVDYVYGQLRPFLIPCHHRRHDVPEVESLAVGVHNVDPLDFKVNPIGNIIFKGPL